MLVEYVQVLTPEECDFLIKSSEMMGYTDAPISTGLNSATMMKGTLYIGIHIVCTTNGR